MSAPYDKEAYRSQSEIENTDVFDRVYTELNLLQAEDVFDLKIAEQALSAAMIFTINNAPSTMHGIQLISHCFNGIITEVVGEVYDEMERNK